MQPGRLFDIVWDIRQRIQGEKRAEPPSWAAMGRPPQHGQEKRWWTISGRPRSTPSESSRSAPCGRGGTRWRRGITRSCGSRTSARLATSWARIHSSSRIIVELMHRARKGRGSRWCLPTCAHLPELLQLHAETPADGAMRRGHGQRFGGQRRGHPARHELTAEVYGRLATTGR